MKTILFMKRNLFLGLAIVAMLMLAGCSSTDEAAQPEDTGGTGGGEDCSRYTNQVDVTECEARNQMRGY